MGEMTYYKCTECGKEDSDRGIYGSAPVTLICWNCRAGRDAANLAQTLEAKKGMFPVKDGLYPWGEPAPR